MALSVSLTLMLLLRVPNQICVSMQEPHGWYSVRTLVGAAGFGYLAFVEYQQKSKSKKK